MSILKELFQLGLTKNQRNSPKIESQRTKGDRQVALGLQDHRRGPDFRTSCILIMNSAFVGVIDTPDRLSMANSKNLSIFDRNIQELIWEYSGRKGETLSGIIFQTYGVYDDAKLDKVLRKNPNIINPHRIFAGQVIELPVGKEPITIN